MNPQKASHPQDHPGLHRSSPNKPRGGHCIGPGGVCDAHAPQPLHWFPFGFLGFLLICFGCFWFPFIISWFPFVFSWFPIGFCLDDLGCVMFFWVSLVVYVGFLWLFLVFFGWLAGWLRLATKIISSRNPQTVPRAARHDMDP